MNDKSLNWKDFDWSKFQTLCLWVAETIFPDCNFDEYLKEGQRQDGIDLISFIRKDGSFLGVQCKDVRKISLVNIDKFIKDILEGDYKDKLSFFVLATSADLQSKTIQLGLNERKLSLFKDYGITFECWDRQAIETRLKKMWSVVSKFFGKQQADDFCYQQSRNTLFDSITPVEDFIPRTISKLTEDISEKNYWQTVYQKDFDLTKLFLENRLQTHRICLIGDAYQGKSFYLRHAAYNLKKAGVRIQPLLIEIKAFNVQSLEALLENRFGAWKDIPFKDLIIFIDGLDEVPTDKFDDMLKYIAEFSNAYRSVNIVLSCRRLFYTFYGVNNILTTFDFYSLNGLISENIDSYLKRKLGPLFHDFKDAIYKNELLALLYQPFYLVNLAVDYSVPPHKLPGSKLKVLDAFIERSLTTSHSRQLKDSDKIKMNSVLFKRTIEKFAFALQLAGLNAFKHSEIQQLFTRPEQILLQHNSLVSISEDSWSFNNALFQEHLAASLLSQLKYEDIIVHCAIGKTYRKVKTKWIQTLSSALSLLESESELFKRLLQFIENDNIELIFQTERSKHTPAFKILVLQKLITKCKLQNIRPLILYEETIGVFVDNVPGCMEFLLDCLANSEFTNLVKIVCARIIRSSSLTEEQQVRFKDLGIQEVSNTSDGDYAGYMLEIFTSFKIGDREMIMRLIEMAHLTELHVFRSKLYELITTLGLVDEFYEFGLDGIQAFLKHNERISHGGSETNLQNFLLATRNRHLLARLLTKGKGKNQFTYIDYQGSHKEIFLSRLFHKLAEIFESDPLIILSVARFIKELGRRYLRNDLKEVDEFLEKTKSHNIVARLLINDMMKDNDWELGALITEDCYDYVLWEYEVGGYGISSLKNCLSGMRYKHKSETDATFYKLCIDATGGEIENRSGLEQHLIYLEAEAQKRKNDLVYIQSIDAFKNGILKYFHHYGKKSISEDDLYIDSEHRSVRQQSDSYFLYEFLAKWVPHDGKSITEKGALIILLTPGNFETFRAEEIMDYPYMDDSIKKIFRPVLEEYYLVELPSANFVNCLWSEPGKYHWLRKEFRLGEIFRKYQFSTPEEYMVDLIWLDQSGSRAFESSSSNRDIGISQLVISRLDSAGLLKLKKKVVENIQTGIRMEAVLGTHIALCKKLQIVEAKDLVLTVFKEWESDSTLRIDAINIYIELGGDLENIISIFRSWSMFNDFCFMHLCNILIKSHAGIVIEMGNLAMAHSDTSDQRKIQISELVAQAGGWEGFAYLVNDLRKNKIVSYHMGRGCTIVLIDTVKALNELEDIMYLVIDERYYDVGSFHDTARYQLLEWIYQLAGKSEADLIMVAEFLERIKGTLRKEFSTADQLNWYINRIFENFRGSDKTTRSIEDIKNILQSFK